MSNQGFDPRVLGGLLHFEHTVEGRLRTLRFAMGEDPSARSHIELIRIYCNVELIVTTQKVESLKQRPAKLRHVRAAIDGMIEAGAKKHAQESLAAARALLERTENPPPPVKEEIDPERQHLTLEELDVLVLETTPGLSSLSMEDMVFEALWAARERRRKGSQWLAFSATGRLHHSGKSSWIGLSRGIPGAVVDGLQSSLIAEGVEVEREMCRWRHVGLMPFARLSDDGLEILVPAALAGDPTRKRIIKRGETKPVARGFCLAD